MHVIGRRLAGRTRSARRYAFILVVSVLLVTGFLPSPFVAVSPGPTFELSDMVSVPGCPSPKTSFYMVTVAAEEADWYAALLAAVHPKVAVWTKQALWGGMSADEYDRYMSDLMAESRVRAERLAARWASVPFEVASVASIENREVLGPSAGLAFALQMSSILAKEDLASGVSVAATGVLDDSGSVAAVGGIAQKSISCLESGIELFLVPEANYEAARRNAGDMKVVGVKSLEEAIQAVRGMARSIP